MNAFTFGDQAFLARAGSDYNPMLPMNYPGLWRWYRADSFVGAASMDTIGGAPANHVPWRDESGQFIDSGATVATQTGPTTAVNIAGGAFVFTAAHVGQTIHFNSGGGRNAVIKTRNSATQVIVDVSQSFVGSTTFGVYDDAYNNATGTIWRNDLTFAPMPSLQLSGFLNFKPGTLADFTVMAANRKAGATCMMIADSYVANHQIRRSYAGDNTTLFYAGAGAAASAFGAVNSPQVLTVRRTGAAVTFRENKTSRGGGNDATAWTPVELGSAVLGGNIELAELLIWKGTVLSDAEVDKIYDLYFKPKYSVLP